MLKTWKLVSLRLCHIFEEGCVLLRSMMCHGLRWYGMHGCESCSDWLELQKIIKLIEGPRFYF